MNIMFKHMWKYVNILGLWPLPKNVIRKWLILFYITTIAVLEVSRIVKHIGFGKHIGNFVPNPIKEQMFLDIYVVTNRKPII